MLSFLIGQSKVSEQILSIVQRINSRDTQMMDAITKLPEVGDRVIVNGNSSSRVYIIMATVYSIRQVYMVSTYGKYMATTVYEFMYCISVQICIAF